MHFPASWLCSFDMEDLNTSTDSSQLSQSSSDDEELVFLGGPEPKRPRVVSSSSSESDDMVFPDDGCSEEPSGDASVASDSIAGKVVQVLSETCCPAQCMWNLTIKEAFTSRMKFRSLSNNQQRQWIADKLVENSTISQGEIDTTYLVAGKVVCKTAFTKIHGFSMSRLQRAKKSVSQGQLLISQHGNTGRRKSTSAVEEATVWMERYFHLIGDKQPDKNRIHLPSWETKEDVYHRYEDDMKLRSVFPIGLSTFYRIWNENCPNVVIPKVNY